MEGFRWVTALFWNLVLTWFGVHNLQRYGADPTASAATNTTAFANAVAAMTAGQTLYVPPGTYNITNIQFNPPDGCRLICQGSFSSSAMGVAVRIGDTVLRYGRYNIEGLQVTSPAVDWTAGRVGVELSNLYDALIDVRLVTGFETGLQTIGAGTGYVYNTHQLGNIANCKFLLHLTTSGAGWNNECTFHEGHFSWATSGLPTYIGCIGILIDYNATSNLNNHRFHNPSFEAPNTTPLPAQIAGIHIYIYNPRLEGPGKFTFTANSSFCQLFPGYLIDGSAQVDDQGQKNVIWSRQQLKIAGGIGTADGGVFDGKNSDSAAYVYVGRDSTGPTTFRVKGSGVVESDQWVYALNGFRWYTTAGTIGLFRGNGSPEGVMSAGVGSFYSRIDGSTGATFYVKETGAGNTGWVAFVPVLSGTTAARPVANLVVGMSYFDTTLGKPVWYKGPGWVDATGTAA